MGARAKRSSSPWSLAGSATGRLTYHNDRLLWETAPGLVVIAAQLCDVECMGPLDRVRIGASLAKPFRQVR